MLQLIDGFDHYGTTTYMTPAPWNRVDSSWSLDTAVVRTGTHALHRSGGAYASNGSQIVRCPVPTPHGTIGAGAWFYVSDTPGFNDRLVLFGFINDTVVITAVTLKTDMTVQVRLGEASGTILATSTATVPVAEWFHLEVKLVADNAAGTVEVRLNGDPIITSAPADTIPSGSATIHQIFFGKSGGIITYEGVADWYVDDFFIWDGSGAFNNDFLGPQQVLTRMPVSDEQMDWSIYPDTLEEGHEAVSEIPTDEDDTYIASQTPDAVASFGIQSISNVADDVVGIMVVSRIRNLVGVMSRFRVGLKSVDTIAESDPQTPTPGYSYLHATFNANPRTGQAWTPADLDTVKVRVRHATDDSE